MIHDSKIKISGHTAISTLSIILAGMLCPWAMSDTNKDLERIRLIHDELERSYEMHIPESSPASPLPLLIALHRFTENGRTMARLTGFNQVADANNFIVAYPNGRGRMFNVFGITDRDDTGFILAVIEDVKRRHAIDERRIYVTGASNGGFMVYKLLCDAPDVFAAAAPVMAAMPETYQPAHPIPMLILHGDADPIIPFDGRAISAGPWRTYAVHPSQECFEIWSRLAGFNAPPIETRLPDKDPGDGCQARMFEHQREGVPWMGFIIIEGGGHTWPGGHSRIPAFILGRTSRDFNASELIWTFLSRHALPEPTPASVNGADKHQGGFHHNPDGVRFPDCRGDRLVALFSPPLKGVSRSDGGCGIRVNGCILHG